MLAEPIHREAVAGGEVRYFRSPAYEASRQPDMPWHAVDDLWSSLGMEGDSALVLKRALRQDWEEPRTVATADGLVTIAPHFMADGLIESLIEAAGPARGEFLRKARGRYRYGCTQAFKLMTAHLDPVARMLVMVSAVR